MTDQELIRQYNEADEKYKQALQEYLELRRLMRKVGLISRKLDKITLG